jgi:hypothetical protein
MRLNPNAESIEDINQYFKTRELQLRFDGFVRSFNGTWLNNGCRTACFIKNNQTYISTYIPLSLRGQNITQKVIKSFNQTTVTVPSCNIETYLQHINQPFITAATHTEWPEYKAIEKYYNNQKANRSQQFLMNHIDEGLVILKSLNADTDTMKAFCLHPIFQDDKALTDNYPLILENSIDTTLSVMILTMEYRNIANAYLSTRDLYRIDEIQLSPLTQVNQMLIADKIQNCKDFELYNSNIPNATQLQRYFQNWLNKLNIDPKTYQYWKSTL